MKLKKIVEVDATQADAIDYLRTQIKFWPFQMGDAIEVTAQQVAPAGASESMFSFLSIRTPSFRPTKGMVGVVERYDTSDETILALFIRADGRQERAWVKRHDVALFETMPSDWIPSDLAKELAAAPQFDTDAPAKPSDDDDDEDEDEVDDATSAEEPRHASRWGASAAVVKAAADRAEAASRRKREAEAAVRVDAPAP